MKKWLLVALCLFAATNSFSDICVIPDIKAGALDGYFLVLAYGKYDLPRSAEVKILRRGKVVRASPVAKDGHFRISGVAPGAYELVGTTPESYLVSVRVQLAPSTGNNTKLILMVGSIEPAGCHGAYVRLESKKKILALLSSEGVKN